ncbi:MAG TPA: glycosyltransferase family 39 protein [Polyangiales bacterium]|nr:glycosyltransferase family 39 protein [Polyangiales bacterium]
MEPELSYRGQRGHHSVEASSEAPDVRDASQLFDASAWLVLLAGLACVLATFRSYGLAWDGQGETVFGGLLLKYYTSFFRDHSAFGFVNFRYYGGGFELPAAILVRISPFGPYETRHLFGGLCGLLGLWATWRIARRIGGPRAGALATLLLGLNPTWYGHAFINARDVPFGSGMACCLLLSLQMMDELPTIRWRTRVLFGLALGWTVSVRVGGVLALVFLAVALGLALFARARAADGGGVREAVRVAGALVPSGAVAYAVIGVFWPWAVQSPLNPLRALLMFSDFPFDASVLFDGRLIPARDLPGSYLPMQFALRQPESLLIGIAIALVCAAVFAQRPRRLLTAKAQPIVAVAFAALFPVLYSIAVRPVDYNGMRHFLFVVPPLSVLAALAFDRLFSAAGAASLQVALALTLAAIFALQVRAMIALHPDQYVYFNDLSGGPRSAQGRYELDYWGTSLAEATRRFTRELEHRDAVPEPGAPPFKVYVCGNVWSAATFFPRWLVPVERIEDADFQIAIANFFCRHPTGSRPVLEVDRAGALLSYVEDLRR